MEHSSRVPSRALMKESARRDFLTEERIYGSLMLGFLAVTVLAVFTDWFYIHGTGMVLALLVTGTVMFFLLHSRARNITLLVIQAAQFYVGMIILLPFVVLLRGILFLPEFYIRRNTAFWSLQRARQFRQAE